MTKRFAVALAGCALFAATPALGGDCITLASLTPPASTGVNASTSPTLTPADRGIQVSEWVGAPCMTNDDCGADLKCENSACVEK
ncbi:hypothetical protein [Rhodospira trueperi]|uniref:WAP domain-containing protein n=1 Tax=Rhodospira trueperi TaxID=69960 RepID=A0A1G7G3W4_9PROT|nr:hypothetical protein [Rhodospira trueperi]SDE82812.1 hypothetical protein SAMN05421720_11371 [Rhodospira trueperi]